MNERCVQAARLGSVAAAALFALAALLSASPGAGAAAEPRTHHVSIEAMQFAPQAIAVAPGDTVVWMNKDVFPHTVTAQDKRFDSGEIGTNRSWKLTAKDRGSVDYICTYHPGMKATLIVK